MRFTVLWIWGSSRTANHYWSTKIWTQINFKWVCVQIAQGLHQCFSTCVPQDSFRQNWRNIQLAFLTWKNSYFTICIQKSLFTVHYLSVFQIFLIYGAPPNFLFKVCRHQVENHWSTQIEWHHQAWWWIKWFDKLLISIRFGANSIKEILS